MKSAATRKKPSRQDAPEASPVPCRTAQNFPGCGNTVRNRRPCGAPALSPCRRRPLLFSVGPAESRTDLLCQSGFLYGYRQSPFPDTSLLVYSCRIAASPAPPLLLCLFFSRIDCFPRCFSAGCFPPLHNGSLCFVDSGRIPMIQVWRMCALTEYAFFVII